MLEQAALELDPEDPAHRLIHTRLRDAPLADLREKCVAIGGRNHFHIHPRRHRQPGTLRIIGRHPMVLEFQHRFPIADHKPGKAPFAAENLRKGVMVGGGRDAREAVKGAHHRHRSGLDSGLEGGQIGIAEAVFRNISGVVVTPALRGAIGDIVLEAGGNMAGIIGDGALEAPDGGGGIELSKIRILAKSLCDAPPAGVTGQVNHRGKGPIHPPRRAFNRGHRLDFFHKPGIPCGSHCQGDGKDRAEPMDGIEAHHEGDAQPGFLDRNLLEAVAHGHIANHLDTGQERANLSLSQGRGEIRFGGTGHQPLRHLPELLLHGHPLEEILDAFLGRPARVTVREIGFRSADSPGGDRNNPDSNG